MLFIILLSRNQDKKQINVIILPHPQKDAPFPRGGPDAN